MRIKFKSESRKIGDTWKTKKWMGGPLKHRLHALTVVTSEFMHLFLLKTFSIEIQIGVTLLSIFESCRNAFTCPNELYMPGFITALFFYFKLLSTLVNTKRLLLLKREHYRQKRIVVSSTELL